MLNLFPRVRRYQGAVVSINSNQLPFELETMPLEQDNNPRSFGVGFNLIRMVSEYGPQRIEQIDQEVETLQDRIQKLVAEKEQIQKMLDALN